MSATMCDPGDHVFAWCSDSHYYCECGFQMGEMQDLGIQEAYELLSALADVSLLVCVGPVKYRVTQTVQDCGECLPCRAVRYLGCAGDFRVSQ